MVSISIKYEYDITINWYNDIGFPNIFLLVIKFLLSSNLEFPVRNKVNAAKVKPNNVAIIGTEFWIIL